MRKLRRIAANRAVNSSPAGVANYWTSHNVTNHKVFADAQESLEYFHWRNAQYFDYLRLMPVEGFDGKTVLDYGCGPGNDLVGFGTYSRPRALIGVDVSPASVEQARARVALHGIDATLKVLAPDSGTLPLDTASVDYVHSSGVIHHIPDPVPVLSELRRVLKRDGRMRIMVYNYDSLWLHLYVAFLRQIEGGIDADMDVRQAFVRSTDGPDCPVAHAYEREEFVALAARSGFSCRLEGVAVSCWEMKQLNRRFDAIMDPRLAREHREFLASLRFDERGLPMASGFHAGIDACYLLEPA